MFLFTLKENQQFLHTRVPAAEMKIFVFSEESWETEKSYGTQLNYDSGGGAPLYPRLLCDTLHRALPDLMKSLPSPGAAQGTNMALDLS